MARFSTEFENILKKYQNQKLNTYKVLELLGDDNVFNNFGGDKENKKFGAILNCGTQLVFAKNTNASEGVTYRLKGANFCRERICPMCQFRKAEKQFAEVMRVAELIGNKYRFLHVVLTVPNADSAIGLAEGIKVLYKGFSYLLRYKTIEKVFKGVLRCLEISYNYENDTFHPHLHCLVAVVPSYFNDSKKYISAALLQELWTKAANKAAQSLKLDYYKALPSDGSPLMVHIGAVKKGDYSGIAEVCKYCLKPLQFDDGTDEQNKRILLTLMYTMKGARFVQKYGVIKEAFKLIREAEAEEEKESEVKEMFVFWDDNEMGYR